MKRIRKILSTFAALCAGIVVSACAEMNSGTSAVLNYTGTNYSGTKANIQTANDQAFTAWADAACMVTIGAAKRNNTGNNNAVKALLLACPIPSTKSTVSETELNSGTTTTTSGSD